MIELLVLMPSGACKDFGKRLLDQSDLDTLLAREQFLLEKKPVKNLNRFHITQWYRRREPHSDRSCSVCASLAGGVRTRTSPEALGLTGTHTRVGHGSHDSDGAQRRHRPRDRTSCAWRGSQLCSAFSFNRRLIECSL